MKIIAITNNKGGVGKTTTTLSVASALSRLKKKVLVIDFDPQCNLSNNLEWKSQAIGILTAYDFLMGQCKFSECVVRTSGFDLIPSSNALTLAEVQFAGQPARDTVLRKALRAVKGYDFILIDTPPHIGFLTINAMTVANYVIMPMKPDLYSFQALDELFKPIGIIKRELNPKLRLLGAFVNEYDQRNIMDRECLSLFKSKHKALLFEAVIRKNVSLKEAPSQKTDIFTHDPRSHGAQDFMQLTKEIVRRVQ